LTFYCHLSFFLYIQQTFLLSNSIMQIFKNIFSMLFSLKVFVLFDKSLVHHKQVFNSSLNNFIHQMVNLWFKQYRQLICSSCTMSLQDSLLLWKLDIFVSGFFEYMLICKTFLRHFLFIVLSGFYYEGKKKEERKRRKNK